MIIFLCLFIGFFFCLFLFCNLHSNGAPCFHCIASFDGLSLFFQRLRVNECGFSLCILYDVDERNQNDK